MQNFRVGGARPKILVLSGETTYFQGPCRALLVVALPSKNGIHEKGFEGIQTKNCKPVVVTQLMIQHFRSFCEPGN